MTYGATQAKQDEIVAALGARAATSQPLAGAAAASTSAGPFVPQLSRAIWLTLTGVWAGTVRVLRSTDGGATKVPLTLAGQPWATFTANAAEAIAEETVASATYYLDIALTSGAVTYRLEQ
ncbi:MAG: hypothetical protein VYB32_09185 [Pseudomonadota bacterium]|jgi:hypothetical protein|nr:hypothetical protein [Pseudomonadota bacterium]